MLLLTYKMIVDRLPYSFSIHGIVSIQYWQSLIAAAKAKNELKFVQRIIL